MKTAHPKQLRFAVLATDVVLFTVHEGELKALVMNVNRPPYFVNAPGFPGGIINPDETAEDSSCRQLSEKAGIDEDNVYIEQLATFSDVERDPRGRVVSVAYLALAPSSIVGSEKEGTGWRDAFSLPKLAYDHDKMLSVALERLRSRIMYSNIVGKLLPGEFTLTELQSAYETILRRRLDKRNFRKKLREVGLVRPTGKRKRGGAHRPAELYRMADRKVKAVELF